MTKAKTKAVACVIHLTEKEPKKGDLDLVISPKGMDLLSWELANNIAILLRISPSRKDCPDVEHVAVLVIGCIVELYKTESEMLDAMEACFPKGPAYFKKQIKEMIERCEHMGFALTLKMVTEVIIENQKRK